MTIKKLDTERLLQSRCVVFDLDGTLCDTEEDIYASFHDAVRKCGLEITDASRLKIGPPLQEMIRSAVGEEVEPDMIERISATFRRIYTECDFPTSPLYPGALELLHRLQDAEIPLAVATLKREAPTRRLLEKKGVLPFFQSVYSCDSGGETWNKERMLETILEEADAPATHTIFFGDSTGDIQSGRATGIPTVAVLYGYGDGRELLASEPDFICEDLTELI